MADYIFTAKVRLRVKDEKDYLDAAERAAEFFSLGLQSLAYSDDEDDDPYEIIDAAIDWGATVKNGECEW